MHTINKKFFAETTKAEIESCQELMPALFLHYDEFPSDVKEAIDAIDEHLYEARHYSEL